MFNSTPAPVQDPSKPAKNGHDDASRGLTIARQILEQLLDGGAIVPDARGNLVRAVAELRDATAVQELGPCEPGAEAGYVTLPVPHLPVLPFVYDLTGVALLELERGRNG